MCPEELKLYDQIPRSISHVVTMYSILFVVSCYISESSTLRTGTRRGQLFGTTSIYSSSSIPSPTTPALFTSMIGECSIFIVYISDDGAAGEYASSIEGSCSEMITLCLVQIVPLTYKDVGIDKKDSVEGESIPDPVLRMRLGTGGDIG